MLGFVRFTLVVETGQKIDLVITDNVKHVCWWICSVECGAPPPPLRNVPPFLQNVDPPPRHVCSRHIMFLGKFPLTEPEQGAQRGHRIEDVHCIFLTITYKMWTSWATVWPSSIIIFFVQWVNMPYNVILKHCQLSGICKATVISVTFLFFHGLIVISPLNSAWGI